MWKILLRVLLQNNNYCSEKHGWYISLQKNQARAMVPKHFLPACSRMLHLKLKKNMWWSSDQHYKHTGGKRQTMNTPDWYGLKICEKLTHCAKPKDIYGTMWLILKSTHLVHPVKWVHPWKILVHPGVYDTPGWQALPFYLNKSWRCLLRRRNIYSVRS